MTLIHDGNVRPWKAGQKSTLAKKFGLSLINRTFTRPGGTEKEEYVYVNGKPGITIFAVTDDGNIVIKEEFKQGQNAVIPECPSGIAKPEEDQWESAKRELRGETGFQPQDIFEVPGQFVFGPRKAPYGFRVFIATGCKHFQSPSPDAGEDSFNVWLVTPQAFKELIETGHMQACQSVMAFWYAVANGIIKL